MKRTLIIAALLLVLPSVTFAQKKIAVEVEHTGRDTVGQRIAFAVREGIRGSRGMELVTDSRRPRIKVVVVTIDSSTAERGYSSALSVSYLYDNLDVPLSGALITSEVYFCGTDRATSCAESIVAKIDSVIEQLRRESPNLWKTLDTQDRR